VLVGVLNLFVVENFVIDFAGVSYVECCSLGRYELASECFIMVICSPLINIFSTIVSSTFVLGCASINCTLC